MIFALKGLYYDQLCAFQTDATDAFQATRTDVTDGKGEKSPDFYCKQAAGFIERDEDGVPLVCKVLCYMQGRIDATRGFGKRFTWLMNKAHFNTCLWDKKAYEYHNTELTGTAATLTEKIMLAASITPEQDSPGQHPPKGWAIVGQWVDDQVGNATGNMDPMQNRIVCYMRGILAETYATKCSRWKQSLAFKLELDDEEETVTVTMPNLLAEQFAKVSKGVQVIAPKHVMSEKIVDVEMGDVPPEGDPGRTDYLAKQAEVRSIVAANIYLSNAYIKMQTPTNILSRYSHNPDPDEVMKHIRHMIFHTVSYPEGLRFGGKHLTKGAEQPNELVYPFTKGVKAGYLEWFSDGSLQETSVTGGVAMFGGASVLNIYQRQHLKASSSHSVELVSAGTNLHFLYPINGLLQEWGARQGKPTPFWLDSLSSVYTIDSAMAVKKSIWLLRRIDCLIEAANDKEIQPLHLSEKDMVADPFTKYVKLYTWRRHMHYACNLEGDPPDAYDLEEAARRLDLAYKKKGEN